MKVLSMVVVASILFDGSAFGFTTTTKYRVSRPLFSKRPNTALLQGHNNNLLEEKGVFGIGGNGGIVYNVNRLKRNLVQETVKAYKQELWDLLRKPRLDLHAVEDKLAALVQTNPVSTTTDSNLLDGTWSLKYQGLQASALLDTRRFALDVKLAKTKTSPTTKRKSTPTNPWQSRKFQLEHQHPSMIHYGFYLGGVLSKSSKYNIQSLTRTNLCMQVSERRWKLGGIPIWRLSTQKSRFLQVQVLYLDTDFCVLCSNLNGPFQVYTKSSVWIYPKLRVDWRKFVPHRRS